MVTRRHPRPTATHESLKKNVTTRTNANARAVIGPRIDVSVTKNVADHVPMTDDDVPGVEVDEDLPIESVVVTHAHEKMTDAVEDVIPPEIEVQGEIHDDEVTHENETIHAKETT